MHIINNYCIETHNKAGIFSQFHEFFNCKKTVSLNVTWTNPYFCIISKSNQKNWNRTSWSHRIDEWLHVKIWLLFFLRLKLYDYSRNPPILTRGPFPASTRFSPESPIFMRSGWSIRNNLKNNLTQRFSHFSASRSRLEWNIKIHPFTILYYDGIFMHYPQYFITYP